MKQLTIALLFAFCLFLSSNGAELKLVKAVYGAAEGTRDVTETVRRQMFVIPGICIAIDAHNSLAGKGDPAPGFRKALSMTYTENGAEKTVHAREQDACVILPGAKPTKEFLIIGAWYGAEDRWNEVTGQVKKAYEEKLELMVGNQNFGPDPKPGKPKRIFIVYSREKAFKTILLPEQKGLSLGLFSK